jgi:integrase
MGKEKDGAAQLNIWKPTSDPRIKRRYNGQLYARFTKYGIRIEQRLHETNLAAAKKTCDRLELVLHENQGQPHDVIREKIRVLFGKDAKPDETPVLIGEHWKNFIEFRKAGSKIHKLTPWREKTAHEYDSFWKRSFEPFWATLLPNEVEERWEDFIKAERLRSKKGDQLTFANHTKYFQAFTTYLVLKKILPAKPLIWNPDPDPSEDEEEDGEGIAIPDAVILDMISRTTGAFRCFITMKALHGMRSSEITQLLKRRIDLTSGIIRLRAKDVKTGSKTKKGRIVPLHADAIPALKAQMDRSGDSPYLFPNQRDDSRPMDKTGFYGQWADLRIAVGMPTITPHDLRHSYATKVFSNPNVNPVLACKALGMSMQTAERVYIHFDENHLSMVSANFRLSTGDQ